MYLKEITYDRATRDYAMYLDGELIGFARTYHEAEVTLDRLVFALLSSDYLPSPTPAFTPRTSAELWALRTSDEAAFYVELASYTDTQLAQAAEDFAVFARYELGTRAATAGRIFQIWQRKLHHQPPTRSAS